MICVINFHYQVFINLFILCGADDSALCVYHDRGCVCVCFCVSPGIFHRLQNDPIVGNSMCGPGNCKRSCLQYTEHSSAAANCKALAGGPMKEILRLVIKFEIKWYFISSH